MKQPRARLLGCNRGRDSPQTGQAGEARSDPEVAPLHLHPRHPGTAASDKASGHCGCRMGPHCFLDASEPLFAPQPLPLSREDTDGAVLLS